MQSNKIAIALVRLHQNNSSDLKTCRYLQKCGHLKCKWKCKQAMMRMMSFPAAVALPTPGSSFWSEKFSRGQAISIYFFFGIESSVRIRITSSSLWLPSIECRAQPRASDYTSWLSCAIRSSCGKKKPGTGPDRMKVRWWIPKSENYHPSRLLMSSFYLSHTIVTRSMGLIWPLLLFATLY